MSGHLEYVKNMTTLRTDIERALDELISNEEGMRFQGLAVVLAKQRWPQLIASERKKDLGLDAHAPASLSPDGIGKGLACSLTATLEKIKGDIGKFQQHLDDVKVLLFATPKPVTTHTAIKWADTVRKAHGIALILLPREEIISELMKPSNASICRTHLGIHVSVELTVSELLEKAREATTEVIAAWLIHPRLKGRSKISLPAVKLDQDGRETEEVLDLANLQAALLESRRVVLEAPAGRGKTTTLVQLAERLRDQGELVFLIDLPAWITSHSEILEFIASMPQFRSRGMHSGDLAQLYETVPCSFLLNGWNEVSESYSEVAVQMLANLERHFPKAGIIVATRTHHIRPPLPGSFRAKLLTLSRRQRAEYLQQTLASRTDELGVQLDNDRVLDDLTRTPLILAEVVSIFLAGSPIPKTKVGVLGAVMQLVEKAEEHQSHLRRSPLTGYSQDYLTALAAQMTMQGDVTVIEERARRIVHSESQRLNAAGQIAALLEPAGLLSALCAHHVLERLEYPSVRFRFQHQQFQELYAAKMLKRRLLDLIGKEDPDGNRRFTLEYINKPLWEEPLRLLAEEIGEMSADPSDVEKTVATGRKLLELALAVDPVFTAELARLCGSVVWKEVRDTVGERLRSWYRVGDEHHRQCALAGMLASGSEDFIDLFLPLLTNDDQQVRLRSYRAWREFHVSSLGNNWRDLVKTWKEEYRAEFLSEVVRERRMADIAEEFASTDLSPRVRAASLHALWWIDATDALVRVLNALDEDAFKEILRDRVIGDIPVELRPRARATYEKLLQEMESPQGRLRILLASVEVGGERVAEGLKEELTRWLPGRIDDVNQPLIKSALELVLKNDPQWVSQWVVGRIVDGFLWSGDWITFISSVPETFKQDLLKRIGSKDLEQNGSRSIISILAATADAELAGSVFGQLCRLQSDISSNPGESNATRWAIFRQMDDLFRAIPLNVAVAGIMRRLSPEFDLVEYAVAIQFFGRIGDESSDLRSQISDDLRLVLRKYLKEGVSFVLRQDDFNGELKMHLALALARIGELEDMSDLHQLLQADIERVRRGRVARLRGERGPLADSAIMGCSSWHVQAVEWLNPRGAEDILLEVLHEPEYEQEAASALIRLARTHKPESRLGFHTPDYRIMWEARSRGKATGFNEDHRRRYVSAIKQRISTILEQHSQSGEPDSFNVSFNVSLKKLACAVAVLDACESADFVMEIMTLPGEWDWWTRVDALDALLSGGARLRGDAALKVLNPIIDHIQSGALDYQQADFLLRRCLCLLPFLDPPSVGIARIKEVVATRGVPSYGLREVIFALGNSRCNDALDLLLEFAKMSKANFPRFSGEWIDAVAALDTPESKQIFLSFIDPDIESLDIEQYFEHHDRERLASRIAVIALAELTVRDRLYLLCAGQPSSAHRVLLADVVSRLGTPEALVAGIDLIHDHANPSIPYELWRGLESAFLERHPYGNTGYSYTLEPRSADEIRGRLFSMILGDNSRRRSAWALLGQIEEWRIEHGRPSTEPRHPAFDSGEQWPPIERVV